MLVAAQLGRPRIGRRFDVLLLSVTHGGVAIMSVIVAATVVLAAAGLVAFAPWRRGSGN